MEHNSYPITCRHFRCYLDFTILNAEAFSSAKSSTLYRIDNGFRTITADGCAIRTIGCRAALKRDLGSVKNGLMTYDVRSEGWNNKEFAVLDKTAKTYEPE